jgi:long-chain acyl-CoA synthetase
MTGALRQSVPATLPKLLRRNVVTMADRPAIREKSRGIWQTYTWAEYRHEVHDFALGLAAHGFRRGDKLAVIGDNRPRLYWAQLAAQCLGGIAVPMYQDAIATEMAYVLSHAEIRVVVAEDQEQVDKILSLKARLPNLGLVVYDDPRGMRHYPTRALEPFERVQAAGREFGLSHPGYVDGEIDQGAAECADSTAGAGGGRVTNEAPNVRVVSRPRRAGGERLRRRAKAILVAASRPGAR